MRPRGRGGDVEREGLMEGIFGKCERKLRDGKEMEGMLFTLGKLLSRPRKVVFKGIP